MSVHQLVVNAPSMPSLTRFGHPRGRRAHRPIARTTPLVDVSGAGRPAALAEVREPAAGRRVQDPRRLQHGRAARADEQRARGVITYSSGNHGQAVALAARELGAPAVVVMPTTAPQIKVEGARGIRRRSHLRGHDVAASPGARGGEAPRARLDDGAAVRSRMDHRRPGHARASRSSSSCPDVGDGARARSAAAAWSPASRRRSSCRARTVKVDRRRAVGRRRDEGVDRRRPVRHARRTAQHRRRPDGRSAPATSLRARPAIRRSHRHGRRPGDRRRRAVDVRRTRRSSPSRAAPPTVAAALRRRRRGRIDGPVVAIVSGGNMRSTIARASSTSRSDRGRVRR